MHKAQKKNQKKKIREPAILPAVVLKDCEKKKLKPKKGKGRERVCSEQVQNVPKETGISNIALARMQHEDKLKLSTKLRKTKGVVKRIEGE